MRLLLRLAVLAAAIVLPACHRADSILLVEVAGDETLMVAQFQVTLTVGADTRGLTVPPVPTTITLPASFSVVLDESLTGPVSVHVDALDAGGGLLGSGDTTQDHINVGGDTIITVTGNLTADPDLRYTQAGVAVAAGCPGVQPQTFGSGSSEAYWFHSCGVGGPT